MKEQAERRIAKLNSSIQTLESRVNQLQAENKHLAHSRPPPPAGSAAHTVGGSTLLTRCTSVEAVVSVFIRCLGP